MTIENVYKNELRDNKLFDLIIILKNFSKFCDFNWWADMFFHWNLKIELRGIADQMIQLPCTSNTQIKQYDYNHISVDKND